MIKTKSDLKYYIKSDQENLLYGRNNNSIKKIKLTNHHINEILQYMKYLRYEEYHRNNNGIIHKLSEFYYARRKNNIGNRLGISISANSFGKGLTIYHNGSIIVNGEAKIGENCKLHGNNCIGNDGITLSTPTIANNVDIGFGAVIIGDIYIADNVIIGANAVVNKSCYETGAILAGVPAKVVKMNG